MSPYRNLSKTTLQALGAVGIDGGTAAFAQGEQPVALGTIVCPGAASALAGVTVPASAQAEVGRNLALLQKQIDEANARLVSTVGQGGPNFVQNAILGPLKDKRVATVNRIATAIGRQGTKPQGLAALAPLRGAGLIRLDRLELIRRR